MSILGHTPARALATALAAGSALVIMASAGRPTAAAAHSFFATVRAQQAESGSSSPYPFANGDTFTYSISQTDTLAYPSATPTVTTSTDTATVVTSCPVTFNGIGGLCDFQGIYSSQPLSYLDAYYGYAAAPKGLSDFVDYGVNQVYTSGDYFTTDTYTYSPYQIFLQFPEKVGHHFNSYDNVYRDAAMTTGPNGYRSTKTTTDDQVGAYHELVKTAYPHHIGSTEKLLVNRNASANYEFDQTGYNPLVRSFGVPVEVGSQEVIPVTTSGGNALPATPPPATTVNVPDWFPGGGAPPKKLDDFPTRDNGHVIVPSRCGQWAGTQAEDFGGNDTYLDPLYGIWETGTYDVYMVDGTGDVCDVRAYTTYAYDNLVSGQLLYTESIVTVQTLTSELQQSARRHRRFGHDATIGLAVAPGRAIIARKHAGSGLVQRRYH